MGPKDTWEKMAAWLRGIGSTLPEAPKALLVISAHWETKVPTVIASKSPPLLFDYYGFPPHTYELTWPAPGAPDLAARVSSLLANAGIESKSETERGFDHGVFIPLKVAFPEAQFPTIQLSLQEGLDPETHLKIGRALEPLRDEGVLIIGSGMSYHNMRGLMGGERDANAHSKRFDAWLSSILEKTPDERNEALAKWSTAPSARACHPREEHLLPLMVAAGAGGKDKAQRVFTDEVMNAAVSAVQFG